MAKYRPVDQRVWSDRRFLALTDDGRLLWLFLLTCPSSTPIPGVILGGDAALAEQLGWTVERFREGFRDLLSNGFKVAREGRIVWLKNGLKYQPPAGPNAIKCWAGSWDDVPEGELKRAVWEALRIACKTWSTLFSKMFPEPLRDTFWNPSANPSARGSTHEHEHEHEHEHDPEDQNLSLAGAHAIPPSTEHAGQPGSGQSRPHATQQGAATPGQSASSAAGNVAEPQPDPIGHRVERPACSEPSRKNPFDAEAARHRANGDLAEATWQTLSEMRMKHAAKLGLVDVLPFPTISPSNEPRGFRELRQRIREEGASAHAACDLVLRVLDQQASDTKSIEWLDEKAFLAGAWNKARNTPLKKRKPAVAAQPTPAAAPPKASPTDRSAWLREDASNIAPQLHPKEPA